MITLEILNAFAYNRSLGSENNVWVIAAADNAVEESPCSHGAEMPVVFVPSQIIS